MINLIILLRSCHANSITCACTTMWHEIMLTKALMNNDQQISNKCRWYKYCMEETTKITNMNFTENLKQSVSIFFVLFNSEKVCTNMLFFIENHKD